MEHFRLSARGGLTVNVALSAPLFRCAFPGSRSLLPDVSAGVDLTTVFHV